MKTVYIASLLSLLCGAGSAFAAQPPVPPPLEPIHIVDCNKGTGPCPVPPAPPAPPPPPAPPAKAMKPHRLAHGAQPPAPPRPPVPPQPPVPPAEGPQPR